MSELLKYKQVNWIDGMKVNKDQFIALENHFTARINDQGNNSLNDFNYGLLPHKGDQKKFLSISTIIDNQNYINVKIDRCHAITPGGHRIEISEENADKGNITIKNVETNYDLATAEDDDLFIVISIDSYARMPDGKADPSEYPLRLPFIEPEYKVHLVPTKQVNSQSLGPNMLTVGKIIIKGNKPELDNNYIPPCTSVDSHKKLIEFYDYINVHISSLEVNAVKIIYDINEKHASNILTEIVTSITENLLYFLSTNITGFKWFLNSKPPVHIFEFIVSLARVLRNAFDNRTAEEKEVLLNYFSKHFDIEPSRFKQLLDHTISLSYNHTEIYHTVEKGEDFMNVISLLFSELSKMELIEGKKKESELKKIDIVLR